MIASAPRYKLLINFNPMQMTNIQNAFHRQKASAILMGFKLKLPFIYCVHCQTDTPVNANQCGVCGMSHAPTIKNAVQHPEPELC